jgi:hypothetical protein
LGDTRPSLQKKFDRAANFKEAFELYPEEGARPQRDEVDGEMEDMGLDHQFPTHAVADPKNPKNKRPSAKIRTVVAVPARPLAPSRQAPPDALIQLEMPKSKTKPAKKKVRSSK